MKRQLITYERGYRELTVSDSTLAEAAREAVLSGTVLFRQPLFHPVGNCISQRMKLSGGRLCRDGKAPEPVLRIRLTKQEE